MKSNSGSAYWQVIVATVVQSVAATSVFVCYSVIVAPLQIEFEPSRMVLMPGISAVSLASGIMSPLPGRAVDRYSIRKLMLLGTLSSPPLFGLVLNRKGSYDYALYGMVGAAVLAILLLIPQVRETSRSTVQAQQ